MYLSVKEILLVIINNYLMSRQRQVMTSNYKTSIFGNDSQKLDCPC